MSRLIDFGDPIEPVIPQADFPPQQLITHAPKIRGQPNFRVYMVDKVHQAIWQHLMQEPDIESGGVLVGHPFMTIDNQITYVVISGAIPQHSNNRSVGHFTVGTEEIAAARNEIESKYPGLLVVGWYHSHPGHGIFLSGQDMTIVRSIYNSPWHLALVIDPLQKKEGIFVGPDGQQIGGANYDQPFMSWIGLRQVPDAITAVSLSNQEQDAPLTHQAPSISITNEEIDNLPQQATQPIPRHSSDQYTASSTNEILIKSENLSARTQPFDRPSPWPGRIHAPRGLTKLQIIIPLLLLLFTTLGFFVGYGIGIGTQEDSTAATINETKTPIPTRQNATATQPSLNIPTVTAGPHQENTPTITIIATSAPVLTATDTPSINITVPNNAVTPTLTITSTLALTNVSPITSTPVLFELITSTQVVTP